MNNGFFPPFPLPLLDANVLVVEGCLFLWGPGVGSVVFFSFFFFSPERERKTGAGFPLGVFGGEDP